MGFLGCSFPVREKEAAHVFEVRTGEAGAEFCSERGRKLLEQGPAVLGPLGAILLLLDDEPPDLEVRDDLERVDGSRSRASSLDDQLANLRQ
jgi:hypothetical protein